MKCLCSLRWFSQSFADFWLGFTAASAAEEVLEGCHSSGRAVCVFGGVVGVFFPEACWGPLSKLGLAA